MHRLNFLADEPWDEVSDDDRTRVRWFGHPFGADILGASLRELRPGSPGGSMHMHYGVEEMFFVLAGTPTVRTPEGEEQLSPGDVVYFPEGPEGLHDLLEPNRGAGSAARHLLEAISRCCRVPRAGSTHGWRPATPSVRCPKTATAESSPASTYPRVSDANVGLIPSTAQASTHAGASLASWRSGFCLRGHGFGENLVGPRISARRGIPWHSVDDPTW